LRCCIFYIDFSFFQLHFDYSFRIWDWTTRTIGRDCFQLRLLLALSYCICRNPSTFICLKLFQPVFFTI
jgi:hypothetical protein